VARIAVFEAGLKDAVEQIKVVNRDIDSPLLKYSPTCRVPTLVDGEIVLGESRHICAYFDDVRGRNQFFREGQPDWSFVSVDGMVTGFLDGVVAWVSESHRPRNPVSGARIESERRKALRCLDYFEGVIKSHPEWFRDWDFATISLACGLSLMDFHDFLPNWHSRHTGLKDWFCEQASRPSMIETAPQQTSNEPRSN
jgi:glutathione S-transferase